MPVSIKRAAMCCLGIIGIGINACLAQDMRVYTSVTDLTRNPAAPKVISHSLTLFHAGKVYDYMEEVGEVVIYEPIHHRFILLGKNYAATEVPFAELNHFLETAQQESLRYIDELTKQDDARSAKVAATIRFQLEPSFHQNWDADHHRLELSGGCLNYQVSTAEVESPQYVRQYLEYADWAARLNFVLHPNSTYPEPRLKLNSALREQGQLPTRVDLFLQLSDPVRLRAEHSFSWEFQSVDRKHISHWERTLQSPEVRWMTFREYRQQLLAQKTRSPGGS